MNRKAPIFTVLFMLVSSCWFNRPEDRYYDEAMRYRSEGETSKAVDSFKKSIATAPKSNIGKEALYMLGDVYYQTGDYKKALRIFKLCLDRMDLKSKKRYAILNRIAWINFAKLNAQEEALKYYIKALDYTSSREERFDVLLSMGNCYFKIYKFDLAVEYFNKAVKEVEGSKDEEIKEKIQEALYYMAVSYSFLSQDFAEISLQKNANPQYRTPADDPTRKILEILDKCITYSGKSKYGILCRYQKAEALEELGEKAQALKVLVDLVDVYPNKAVIESKIDRLREGK